VSDPILPQLDPGAIVPHGTASAGGFGLSVTEWRKTQGIIAYWLQKPGGTVFVRKDAGYEQIRFDGNPAEFIRAAETTLGGPVEILFGTTDPQGLPDSVTVVRDQTGQPARRFVATHRFRSLLKA
jgi:hypothetical protein